MDKHQSNQGNEDEQNHEEMHGRKIPKLENQERKQEIDNRFKKQIEEKFDKHQIKRLVEHLRNLENYFKFASLQIQHQQNSLKLLPQNIQSLFPQLSGRVKRLITLAKSNIQFLDIMLMPYKPIVVQALIEERKNEEDAQQLAHNHNCTNHPAIVNMFHQLVRQWGDQPQMQHIDTIISYLRQYMKPEEISESREEETQYKQAPKILVVGCGMGRVIYEIKKQIAQNIQIQGHQTETQLYLCSQYFLNRCRMTHQVYPYIHNFCNFLKDQDPYRCVKIPQIQDDHSFYYPLTLGSFPSIYKTHDACWDVIITTFHNYHIDNILNYLRLIYKILKPGGLWIDLTTSNFDRNIIRFSYKEYENILDRSQFTLLAKKRDENYWYRDKQSLMNEKRVNYFRVMRK